MGYRDLYAKFLKFGGRSSPATEPGTNRGEFLETDKSLSEPLLGKGQEDNFKTAGISAWRQAPFNPTSNPFTGRAYAELILAFLFDARAWLKRDEPIYILELGAGTGAFAFHCLKELQTQKSFFSELQGLDLRYVMTDVAEKNVASWEVHERLRLFQNSGLLDYAVYRPEREDSVVVRHAGITLQPGGLRNPLIVIANYFFDKTRQDLFRISDGRLQEILVNSYRDAQPVPSGDPLTSESVKMSETYREITDARYADARLNALLEEYRQQKDATILFPIGAFDCVRNLRRLSGDKLILIASGKGVTTVEHFEGPEQPTYSMGGGAASCKVNFHAIGRYFENLGGRTLSTSDSTLIVQTTMNMLLSQNPCSVEYSRYAFDEIIIRRNPINYLCQCREFLQGATHANITSYLSFLRMSNFDPVALSSCGEKILQALDGINRNREESLVEVLESTAANVYEVQSDQNAYLWLGRIYFGLRLYDDCLKMFEASEQALGPDIDSLYFMGACHEAKGDHATARQYYGRALDADPKHEHAHAGIQRTADHSS
jgi:tetratricopeptide (TPR) repeat protein